MSYETNTRRSITAKGLIMVSKSIIASYLTSSCRLMDIIALEKQRQAMAGGSRKSGSKRKAYDLKKVRK